jgi:hypothetical protein
MSAARGPDGLTELQKMVIGTVFHSMTGHDIDVDMVEPMEASEFAAALARRKRSFGPASCR